MPEILDQIKEIQNQKELEEQRVHYLGKSGVLTLKLRDLKNHPENERKLLGQALNEERNALEEAFRLRKLELLDIQLVERLEKETQDITLPARRQIKGGVHILSSTIQSIKDYFSRLGFLLQDGPEIEDEFHNFDALNIPAHHPARQSHDTFFLKDHPLLLRTHTSTIQIRALQKRELPVRLLSIGRVYRCDHDATHMPMFHQFECVVIEKNINMQHLKGCIYEFCKDFLGLAEIRLRPSFFPFTEPSAEVDVKGADGKWLEVLGCGMIHPNVLETCGIDSGVNHGFAIGAGIERLCMIKYGISDIRDLYTNDLRFLNHFGA